MPMHRVCVGNDNIGMLRQTEEMSLGTNVPKSHCASSLASFKRDTEESKICIDPKSSDVITRYGIEIATQKKNANLHLRQCGYHLHDTYQVPKETF